MSAAAIRGVVRRLGPSADPPLDADLVAAFVARRDADAFAALVDRHGPTVLGVCRRVLGDAHEAEDAFQVVFLVLAQKVKAVRPAGAVGGWLYGVAVRTANKARVATARRRRREMIAASAKANPDREGGGVEHAELQAILDGELARLPETLRAAVVLCDLQGKTRTEAAAELKCPEGTVAARLHRGRKKLADALSRRGLALPAAGLAAVLTPAAVSAAASRSAVAVAFGSVSPAILALAREVTRSMTTSIHAIALGALALIAGGLLAAGNLGTNDPPPSTPGNPLVAANAGQPDAPKLTGPWKEAKVLEHPGWLVGSVTFSHDGKSLFVGGTEGHVHAYETANWKKLWEYKGHGPFAAIACAPDDKTVAVTFKDGASSGVRVLNAKTGGPGGDTLEEENAVKDWTEPLAVAFFPDSVVIGGGTEPVSTTRKVIYGNPREYLVKTWLVGGKPSTIRSGVVPGGKKPADAYAVPLAVDPSGKRVVVTGPIDRASGKNVLWAWSAGSGVGNKLLEGHKAAVVAAAWSKDGKTILTGDAGGVVIAWDAETFKEKARIAVHGRIAAVAVSPNGKDAAAAVVSVLEALPGKENYSEEVFVWPVADSPQQPKPISRTNAGGPFKGVASVAFAPDGNSLVSAFCNFTHLLRTGRLVGRVRIFKVSGEEPRPSEKPGYVQDIRFSPDGTLYAVSPGVTLHHKSGKTLYSVSGETAGFSTDSRFLFVMGRDKVLECDGATGKVLKEHPRPKTKWGWHIVSFAPDGKHYAAHFGFNVRVYDTATGFEPVQLDNQHEPGSSAIPGTIGKELVWSPDGKQVAAVGVLVEDGKVGLASWDVGSGKRLYSFAADFQDGPRAIAFSADSQAIAIAYEKRIDIWTGGLNREKKLSGQGQITALAFSKDGKQLAAGIRLPIRPGSDGENARVPGYHTQVRLIDIESDKVVKTFDGFEGMNHVMEATKLPVTALTFSPDGKKLFAGTGIVNLTEVPGNLPQTGELKVFDLVSVDGNSRPLENASLRKFQGAWKLDGFELGGGNKLTAEEIKALGWTLTIEGNKFQSADKDGKGTSSGRIAVDDSQKPPVLVRIMTDRENDLYGWSLYELDGDTLRLCQDVHQKGKPKEFKATADTTIATYKRVKK